MTRWALVHNSEEPKKRKKNCPSRQGPWRKNINLNKKKKEKKRSQPLASLLIANRLNMVIALFPNLLNKSAIALLNLRSLPLVASYSIMSNNNPKRERIKSPFPFGSPSFAESHHMPMPPNRKRGQPPFGRMISRKFEKLAYSLEAARGKRS